MPHRVIVGGCCTVRFYLILHGRVYPLTPFSAASWCCAESHAGVLLLGTRQEADRYATLMCYFARP